MKTIKATVNFLVTTIFLLNTILAHNAIAQSDASFLIGYGKADITYTADHVGLFGFGVYDQRIADPDHGHTSPLYCRVVSIKDPKTEKQIIYLHADLGAIFHPLRTGLVAKIKENLYPDFDDASLLMSASHTHCAPSGMSHYALYMMSAPGYNPTLVENTVDRMYEAVLESIKSQQPSFIEFKKGTFSPEIPVAYNRALKAYNENEEISANKLKRQQSNIAINRNMDMLSFVDIDGNKKGFINWFGVHPIEVLGDHNFVDGASKGYAAMYAEEALPADVVCIFAQSGAGDVATTDYHNKKAFTKFMKETLDDDSYSCYKTSLPHSKWNGKLQSDKALMIQDANEGEKVVGAIDYELIYVDLSDVTVDKLYNSGDKNATTSAPCLGASFFSGKFEWRDKSIFRRTLNTMSIFSDKPENQSPKKIIINGEDNSFIGIPLKNYQQKKSATFFLKRLAGVDLVIKEVLRQQELEALNEHTLLPKILPIQILRIGNIAIAGIPTEITTIAHNRLQDVILEVLKKDGVAQVIISSYANEYAGYTTTYEEYQVQRYEGGHTLYGKHQLGAFQTEFKKLANEMLKTKADRKLNYDLRPPVFSKEELDKRSNLIPLKK